MKQKVSASELKEILSNRISDYPNQTTLVEDCFIEAAVLMDSVPLDKGKYFKDFRFVNCEFYKQVWIAPGIIIGNIFFENCDFHDHASLPPQKTDFKGTNTFRKNLECILTTADFTVLGNCDVLGNLRITGAGGGIMIANINKSTFPNSKPMLTLEGQFQDVEMLKISTDNFIVSDNCVINNEVNINTLHTNEIYLVNPTIKNGFKINNSTISDLSLSEKYNIGYFNVTDCNIPSLSLGLHFCSKADFFECDFKDMFIYGDNASFNHLTIEKSTTDSIKFFKIKNHGLISLRELTIAEGGLLSLISCTLGKFDFLKCDFSKAKLEFQNSKLVDAFVTETEFPKKILLDGKENHEQAQLAFGQLATAFQKQGDNVRYLEYSAREIEAHYYNIHLKDHFFTKLNLGLNRISNKFGRSWGRGILFTLIAGIIFFIPLLITTNKYYFGWPSFDIDLLPAYLKFINPIRFFELSHLFDGADGTSDVTPNAWSYFWDFLGRLFVAYGYYQTIQAFRRYGRK